jgi:hypothetical protein
MPKFIKDGAVIENTWTLLANPKVMRPQLQCLSDR